MLALANLAAWILQTTILVAVALAAIRLLRLDAPAVRYHFLRALIVICLALPFVQPRVDEVAPRQDPVAASAPSATRDWSSAPRAIGSRMPLSLPDAAMMLVATGMALRFSWICAVWSASFSQFMHDYVSRERASTGREAPAYHGIDPQGDLPVGAVIRAAIEKGLRVDGVTFPDETFIDIGTPENLAHALRQRLELRSDPV